MDRPRTAIADDLPRDVLRRGWRSGPERSRLLNSGRADWSRPLRRRRLLTAGYLANVLGQALGLALLGGALTTGLLLLGLTTLSMVFFIGSLNAATRGVTDLHAHHVDERQRQERAAAYETAYRLGAGIALAALLALILAPGAALEAAGGSIVFTVFMVLLMLPTLIVAWTASD